MSAPVYRYDIEQNSSEWTEARRGIPTSSRFGQIVTPAKLQLSAQATKLAYRLAMEWMTGQIDDGPQTMWMERGFLLQPEALEWYALDVGADVTPVGIVFSDDRCLIGTSPDGLVGDDGQVEVKCPTGAVHLMTVEAGEVPSEYVPQVQGSLMVTRRRWCDFVSYYPGAPPARIRVEPDPEYQFKLSEALELFLGDLRGLVVKWAQVGYPPRPRRVLNDLLGFPGVNGGSK